MSESGPGSACLIPPAQFEILYGICTGDYDVPLNLDMVKHLSLFVNACVLHEDVIVPNHLAPQFRHAYSPNRFFFPDDRHGRRDRLEYRLSKNKHWQFVNYEFRLSDAGHTSGFKALVKHFEDENERHKKKNESDDSFFSLLHPDEFNPDLLSYVDRLAAAAEHHKATLVPIESKLLSPYLAKYQRVITSPEQSLLDELEEDQREEINKARSQGWDKFRPLHFYAPALICQVISDARDREGVLYNIADLHHFAAPKFRDLVQRLLTSNQDERLDCRRELEKLMKVLANRKSIPSASSSTLGLIIKLISPLKAIINFGLADLTTGLKDFVDAASGRGPIKVYSAMSFMNEAYDRKTTSAGFYQELKRVFGDLEFTPQELDDFLGEGLNDVETSIRSNT